MLRAGAFLLAAAALALAYPKVLAGLVALGAIIMVHELGHFTVMKLGGIKVEIFSIGFGSALLSHDFGGTRYQVAAIPLGGFVKPAGEFEEKAETEGKHGPDEFLGKPWYLRALALGAGPLANFAFPIVFLFALYASVGIPFFIAPPLVMDISKDSAAEEAGIKKGDQILKVDGAWTFDVKGLVKQVDDAARAHPGKETSLSLLRGGKQLEIKALSRLDHGAARYRLGVVVEPGPPPLRRRVERVGAGTPAEKAGFLKGDEILSVGGKLLKQGSDFNDLFTSAKVSSEGTVAVELARLGKTIILNPSQKQPLPEGIDARLVGLFGLELERDTDLSGQISKRYEHVGLWRAAEYSFLENLSIADAIIEGIWSMIRGKVGFRESIGGPVAIARMAKQQAEIGYFELMQFMMRISVMLGIMNLLPIPLLDGGTLLLCFVEGARRRPLPFKVQTAIQNIFGALLISVMLFATYNDLINLFRSMANR
jgi:regulator of sigma E protease